MLATLFVWSFGRLVLSSFVRLVCLFVCVMLHWRAYCFHITRARLCLTVVSYNYPNTSHTKNKENGKVTIRWIITSMETLDITCGLWVSYDVKPFGRLSAVFPGAGAIASLIIWEWWVNARKDHKSSQGVLGAEMVFTCWELWWCKSFQNCCVQYKLEEGRYRWIYFPHLCRWHWLAGLLWKNGFLVLTLY